MSQAQVDPQGQLASTMDRTTQYLDSLRRELIYHGPADDVIERRIVEDESQPAIDYME